MDHELRFQVSDPNSARYPYDLTTEQIKQILGVTDPAGNTVDSSEVLVDLGVDDPTLAAANDSTLTTALQDFLTGSETTQGRGLVLPKGSITVNPSGLVTSSRHTGIRVRGLPGGTSLAGNGGLSVGYNLANSQHGDTIGYLGTFDTRSGSTFRIVDTAIDPDYAPYDCVILGHYNATQIRDSQQQVARILSNVPSGPVFTTITVDQVLNATYFPTGGNAKWIKNSRPGSYDASVSLGIFTCSVPSDASLFVVGEDVWLTDGFAINDLWGEPAVVTFSDATTGLVRLDPPPTRAYISGRTALIAGPWHTGGQFSDMEVTYSPTHGVFRNTFTNITFTLGCNPAASAWLDFIKCTGAWEFDSVKYVTLTNCVINGMSLSECCSFVTVDRCFLFNYWFTQFASEDITIKNSHIAWGTTSSAFGFLVQFLSGLPTPRTRLIGNYLWSNYGDVRTNGADTYVVDNYLHTGTGITLEGTNGYAAGNWGPGRLVLTAGSSGRLGPNTCEIVREAGSSWIEDLTNAEPIQTDQVHNGDRLAVRDRVGAFLGYLPVVAEKPSAAHFELSETSGQAFDSSGNGHGLNEYGTCPLVTIAGRTGRSFPNASSGLLSAYHDGTGDHPVATEAFGIVPGQVLTVVVIFYVPAGTTTSGSIVNLWQNENQWLISYSGSADKVVTAVRSGGADTVLNSGTGIAGAWVMGTMVIDDVAKSLSIRINDDSPLVVSYSGTIGTAGNIFAIGNDGYLTTPFPGYIDDVLIIKRALTTDEWDSLWNDGDISYWPLSISSAPGPSVGIMTAAVTNSTATLANLSELSVPVTAGETYIGDMTLKVINSVAAEGIKIDFGGGGASASSFWAAVGQLAGGANTSGTAIVTALSSAMTYSLMTGETLLSIKFSLVCSVTGSLVPRVAENTAGSGTLTVRAGSSLSLQTTKGS